MNKLLILSIFKDKNYIYLQNIKINHIPKADPTFSSGGRDGNIRSVMFIIVCRQLSLIINRY